jgi:hypothetical protein
MNITFIITGALIILMGFAIKQLKLYDFIAGYNTMSPKEKILFDIEKFALMMQNTFLVMGLLIILGALTSIWMKLEYLGLITLFVALTVCLPYLIIKGQQLKKS